MYEPYDSLVPIYIEWSHSGKVEQIATAVYVSNQMGRFLFTAAHVTDDRENGRLLIPLCGQLQEVYGYVAHNVVLPDESRQRDLIDTAYIKLDEEQDSLLSTYFTPTTGDNVELLQSAESVHLCSVAGYPASKSGNFDGAHSSEIFAYSGFCVSPDIYEKHGLSLQNHIAVRFNRRKAIRAETEEIFTPPGLKGVSGGGMFAWPKEKLFHCEWSERKLIGVFHTYKEKEQLMIGSTLVSFLGALTLGRMKGFGGF